MDPVAAVERLSPATSHSAMPAAIVVGGGLAGLAAAAALGSAGFRVDLYESRGFLGGRATSYPVPLESERDLPETIDNCQHILLRCCVNLLDFYKRLGVLDRIQFHRQFFFVEPGGRTSTLTAGRLPKPFHFTESFWHLTFLNLADKLAVGRALLAIQRERKTRDDLDRISMLDWLREKKQTPRAIARFWNQVLVSAINEDLDRMAASHGFQVFWLGFLARSNTYEMGIPSIPLGDLYGAERWTGIGNVQLHLRAAVDRVAVENGSVRGVKIGDETRAADYYVLAVPFERVPALAPELQLDFSEFSHSPITGIHLWFDRAITQLPHATLLDRTIQW
ncbi:MAG: FAD-dependent oxidoreductase, partial [Acidobacteriaceae bacterium]|nr:FAD-dependent oxidoreductase [Acidobacteriaceae bacterium]